MGSRRGRGSAGWECVSSSAGCDKSGSRAASSWAQDDDDDHGVMMMMGDFPGGLFWAQGLCEAERTKSARSSMGGVSSKQPPPPRQGLAGRGCAALHACTHALAREAKPGHALSDPAKHPDHSRPSTRPSFINRQRDPAQHPCKHMHMHIHCRCLLHTHTQLAPWIMADASSASASASASASITVAVAVAVCWPFPNCHTPPRLLALGSSSMPAVARTCTRRAFASLRFGPSASAGSLWSIDRFRSLALFASCVPLPGRGTMAAIYRLPLLWAQCHGEKMLLPISYDVMNG